MSDKNLQTTLSPALLARVRQAADAEHMTVDEFVVDAIERRLDRGTLDDILAFGKKHARDRGLRTKDVSGAIAAERWRVRKA